MLYGADSNWWRRNDFVPDFDGFKVTCQEPIGHGVYWIQYRSEQGLETDPSFLATGGNSGYQAINLAVHFGATRIVLLGYDMQRTGGKTHWHGDHPAGMNNPVDGQFETWRLNYKTLVEPLRDLGVEVVNCSRETALDMFPRMPLSEAF